MNELYTLGEILGFSRTLPKEESKLIRSKLIAKYCDTSTDYYQQYYRGTLGYLLWDCINRDSISITTYHIKYDPPFKKNEYVYLFWDFYDDDNPLWGAGREYIFEIKFELFVEHLNSFPKDTYIFNKDMSRLLVRSHEGDFVDQDALLLYCE